ncbi:anti-sigma factor antagonist [Thalassotalea euphylliae]|uniref:Anti-sigma factor antagonist n=1 Tax=Thalassotalea euphylliae TaxID=1655234 RepID=A0A3E0TME6_9GAMM|nr:STAS domain-containing protein [Thalassotalea euphylliae]REL25332.1 anti-sigma factor antagonist [Thalassotalea euphylliae]
MSLSNEKVNDSTIVINIDEQRFDAVTAPRFKQYFLDTVGAQSCNVVLDLSRVNFMDSSGLGVLISSLKHLNSQGAIVLVGIQSNVQALMTLTRMDRLFPQCANVEEALNLAVS